MLRFPEVCRWFRIHYRRGSFSDPHLIRYWFGRTLRFLAGRYKFCVCGCIVEGDEQFGGRCIGCKVAGCPSCTPDLFDADGALVEIELDGWNKAKMLRDWVDYDGV